MEVNAARTGFALHEEPDQGNIGRSMKVGDLVRLTVDGVVAAWYPDMDAHAVGVVVRVGTLEDKIQQLLPDQYSAAGTELATVHWPLGRDTHLLQDLDIVRKYFS
jgi:DhnA family fructose-bisphosphate aldolase class Ia